MMFGININKFRVKNLLDKVIAQIVYPTELYLQNQKDNDANITEIYKIIYYIINLFL